MGVMAHIEAIMPQPSFGHMTFGFAAADSDSAASSVPPPSTGIVCGMRERVIGRSDTAFRTPVTMDAGTAESVRSTGDGASACGVRSVATSGTEADQLATDGCAKDAVGPPSASAAAAWNGVDDGADVIVAGVAGHPVAEAAARSFRSFSVPESNPFGGARRRLPRKSNPPG